MKKAQAKNNKFLINKKFVQKLQKLDKKLSDPFKIVGNSAATFGLSAIAGLNLLCFIEDTKVLNLIVTLLCAAEATMYGAQTYHYIKQR